MNLIFVGQNILGGYTLQSLVKHKIPIQFIVTRPDNDYPNMVNEVAARHKLAVFKTNNINNNKNITKEIHIAQPDVFFCCSWGQIIKQPLLKSSLLGWVNFHPSYLPEYRGPSPIEWQLIHGRKKGGCTAHFMASKYDAGPILLQKRIEIDTGDNRETMQLKCGLVMGKLALGVIKLLKVNPNVKGLLQNEQYMSYAPHRETARCLNTNQTAENVRNQVRGLSPFPCALIKFGLQTLSIESVAITSQPSKTNKPMFISPKGRLLIAATDFYLEILTVRYRKKIISDYFFLLESL